MVRAVIGSTYRRGRAEGIAVPTNDGSEFMFPSEGKAITSCGRRWQEQRVCARVEITGLRAHDFRRSINSWLHDEGLGYDVRSRLMAHSSPDITSLVYDQSKLIVPLREALVRCQKHVARAAGSNELPNDVTPMAFRDATNRASA
jgi:integrase